MFTHTGKSTLYSLQLDVQERDKNLPKITIQFEPHLPLFYFIYVTLKGICYNETLWMKNPVQNPLFCQVCLQGK